MKHPYVGLAAQQFWKNSAGIKNYRELDPVSTPNFKIMPDEKIVTAGSCFAQHVARFMSGSGYNHFIVEKAHPILSQEIAIQHNYGLFSARYGNIYTARQLKQLLLRAYGQFSPIDSCWLSSCGSFVVDPFRPQIQPRGYVSSEELTVDRNHHFSCIRTAIKEMDVFIFTLGLTEAWVDKRDGAVFPLAPGVVAGEYDPGKVDFINFDEAETFEDLKFSLKFIRRINPEVKIILTVSPVALNATYEPRDVLLSTVWSKAILRIAAEKAIKEFSNCVYFPSYEIITSPHVRGNYFAPDCREVTRDGVEHVMALFLRHFTAAEVEVCETIKPADVEESNHLGDMEDKVEVLCDEAAITNEDKTIVSSYFFEKLKKYFA
ncbi:GSCFA domain-containing protein [Marinobacter vulgaris]|uniref:GSCFA domain-containing protein n=1 Tax=Marinobacter vulgaris TaxID=1928331 RepID=A0A2V3ZJG8_9GAMM|nr:GSCFA domain-containing protein [Marinobacter vulgaris]PXX88880.1 GSCFA domain-containing protein [Marinobacter vulgaris]TSJ66689.1 GSCFA domain-containing protein [Marinobacter vulgaris]